METGGKYEKIKMKNYSLKWVFITSRQIIQEHVVIHGIGNVVPVASSGTFGATWELEGGVDLTWQSDHAVMQLSTYKRICLYIWMLYQQHFWSHLRVGGGSLRLPSSVIPGLQTWPNFILIFFFNFRGVFLDALASLKTLLDIKWVSDSCFQDFKITKY